MSLSNSINNLRTRQTERHFVPVAIALIVVFSLDFILPLGVASGVLHVAVVLLALRSSSGRFVVLTAVLCSGLTLLDIVISPGPGRTEWWKVIVNRGLSLLVIWVTAILGLQRNRAAEAERRHLGQLAHLSRVQTAECLAGALAHELNQPLTAVALQAEVVNQKLNAGNFATGNDVDSKELTEALQEIADQSHRASRVLQSLRRLIRKSDSTRQHVSIGEIIEEAVRLIEPAARESQIDLRWHVNPRLPLVCVDRIQIEQVILNLLQNAFESFARKAACEVALPSANFERFVDVSAKIDPPNWVRVTVSDNGPGIASEKIASIFEPFATSKTHGLGLGLPICRSILESHGGRLSLDQTATRTTLHIDLPRSDSEASCPNGVTVGFQTGSDPLASLTERVSPRFETTSTTN